jgi:TATA-box binding protein (TBP) (component of TFIID and TFIIIB)
MCDNELKFEDIKVSTRTFTVQSNLDIDVCKLFHLFEITPYVVIKKKRGRKKKGVEVDPNKDIKSGSVITVKHLNMLRGVDLKASKRVFRNSATVVIMFDKLINIKMSSNGTFVMTGCKNVEHAIMSVKYVWNVIKDAKDVYTFVKGNSLHAIIAPVMRNIDFSIGFLIDRTKLAMHMHTTKHLCVLETEVGYTGVNIKFEVEKSKINDIVVVVLKWEDDEFIQYNSKWSEYLDMLDEKARAKKVAKDKYNTFLVFHSGKAIMSGIEETCMEGSWHEFMEMMKTNKDKFIEKLD